MSTFLKENSILSLGNPLLDISVCTDTVFLKKYDLEANNAILAEEKHFPMYAELADFPNVEYTAGGSAQNSMRALQWNLSVPRVAAFMGCIGRDKFGHILESKARADGVNAFYQYEETVPTGTCAVVITNKGNDRSLCANLAAANNFNVTHLDKLESKRMIDQAKIYYITGFFLTVSPESIIKIGKFAHDNKKTFCMNLSAPFLSQFFLKPMMEAMPYVDILFGNEEEAQTFSTANDFKTTDVREICTRISQLPKINSERKRTVIITRGQYSVIVVKDDSTIEFPVEPMNPNDIVDTNGAGDAFVGGFFAQYIQGESLDNCISCGISTAKEVIGRSGCTFSQKE